MKEKAGIEATPKNSLEHALYLDATDPLKHFRERFYFPLINGKDAIYFTGNSLGLQARSTQEYVLNELEDWANFGVEGHTMARHPWVSYHEMFPSLLSGIVGAKENELVVMNQLTVNLHLLMTSFYRPSPGRYKIIMEAKAFPSDQYAIESQVKLHGLDPATTIIEISPKQGEYTLQLQDILDTIRSHGNETALVLMGGVNYYTGQVFDMRAITKAAQEMGCVCGFDLAHAAGNIELKLHDWNVDFACWCSYKYLNSGPGGVAGVFIHERHITNRNLPRLAGWWGHDKDNRFKMESEFSPIPTAEGWQLSNAPILSMAAHKAALDIFNEAGMQQLITKSKKLTEYLFYILDDINDSAAGQYIELITPREENAHGCQVSMLMLKDGKKIFDELKRKGVIADWREPNVIRIAPVPLYNSFEDIYRFAAIIQNMIN